MNKIKHGLVMSEVLSEDELIDAISEAQSDLWQDDHRGGEGHAHEHLRMLKEELRDMEAGQ
tara:strand:+ start:7542 stop:7724 length:183 start_codon:yes stop_codon:yes gene_type:complete